MNAVPETPFYGDAHQRARDCYIHKKKPARKAHYLREKLVEMMQAKVVIPKQYWLLASDAAFKHECIAGKQLPKARKQMSTAQQDELKAILAKEEHEFEPFEDEMPEDEEQEMQEPDAPKVDQHV